MNMNTNTSQRNELVDPIQYFNELAEAISGDPVFSEYGNVVVTTNPENYEIVIKETSKGLWYSKISLCSDTNASENFKRCIIKEEITTYYDLKAENPLETEFISSTYYILPRDLAFMLYESNDEGNVRLDMDKLPHPHLTMKERDRDYGMVSTTSEEYISNKYWRDSIRDCARIGYELVCSRIPSTTDNN